MNSQYVVIGIVAIVIGVAFAAVAWTHILPYREATTNTETVDATVVSSEVTKGFNSESQVQYRPYVVFRYTYEGTEYTSDTVFPGPVSLVSDRSEAQAIVERYPAGQEVTAYVNRNDPQTAFLIDRSAPLWFWAGPVIAVLVTLYGCYSVVLGIRGADSTAQAV